MTKSAGADLNSAKRWPEGRVYRKYTSNTASDVSNKVENSFAKGIKNKYKAPIQLTLPFDTSDVFNFNNFYTKDNESLHRALYQAALGRGESLIYFWGAPGSGRTHLLQAACCEAHRINLKPVYLSFSQLGQLTPGVLDNLETLDLICIDDLEHIANQLAWEEAFFDCFNRIWDSRKRLLIASRDLPHRLGLSFPDLASRLSSGVTFHLASLSEKDKWCALQLRAEHHGFRISESVAQFMLNHYSRDMHNLFSALNRLSEASLEAKHRITIPFVKQVLGM
jgi:DnaA family protein